jgi:hypothetical protein
MDPAADTTPIWKSSAPHLDRLDPVCRVDLNKPILLRLVSYSDGLKTLQHLAVQEDLDIQTALGNYNNNSPKKILTDRRFATKIRSSTSERPRQRHPAARSYSSSSSSTTSRFNGTQSLATSNNWTLGPEGHPGDSTLSTDSLMSVESTNSMTSSVALEADWGTTSRAPKYIQDRQHLIDEGNLNLSSRLTKKLPCQYEMGEEPPKGRRRENTRYRYERQLTARPLHPSPIQRNVFHITSPEKVLGPVASSGISHSYGSTWAR